MCSRRLRHPQDMTYRGYFPSLTRTWISPQKIKWIDCKPHFEIAECLHFYLIQNMPLSYDFSSQKSLQMRQDGFKILANPCCMWYLQKTWLRIKTWAFLHSYATGKKRARFSNSVKKRDFESCSNISFPLEIKQIFGNHVFLTSYPFFPYVYRFSTYSMSGLLLIEDQSSGLAKNMLFPLAIWYSYIIYRFIFKKCVDFHGKCAFCYYDHRKAISSCRE